MSILDSPGFNASLFFPRRDPGEPPPGTCDLLGEGPAAAGGVRLQIRAYPAPSPGCLVLLFPGNGEIVADYAAVAPDYHRMGASLLVASYRGYGRSEGTPTLRALLHDARIMLDAVFSSRTFPPGASSESPLPLVILGRSLGGACAAELAGAMPALAGLILDSCGSDLRSLVARRGLDPSALVEEDFETFCPLRKLARWRGPLLVLHGEQDEIISVDEGRALFHASPSGDKRLETLPGRGHNDLWLAPRYWQALGAFLSAVAARS